jgi:hypothetical protein
MNLSKVLWRVSLTLLWGIFPAGTAHSLEKSVGREGIDALRLHGKPHNLTGKGIYIGQVELSRPSQFGVDKVVNRLINLDRYYIQPYEVFFRDGKAIPNKNIDEHSAQVAAVMISRHKIQKGVAPMARLVSSAYSQQRKDGQPEAAIAAQHLALQYQGLLRAINFSFGEPLSEDRRSRPQLDGNALLTLMVDWLAYQHQVLPVIAGNQGRGGIPIPTDTYNGIVVGFTREQGGAYTVADRSNLIDEPFYDRNNNGQYDEGEHFTDLNRDGRWTPAVESPTNNRRSLALLAPGNNILVPNNQGKVISASGTSFASPHVVGVIALLHEYIEQQIADKKWGVDARRPEVTKAVLINSADKIADPGDGKLLGMSKTIYDADGKTWLESDAAKDQTIPLSLALGAGQLNAYRAYLQLQAGQQFPGLVRAMGWDSQILYANQFRDYVFEQPLLAGSYVSATLTWHRQIFLRDKNGNRHYDIGEGFVGSPINNLDLYLLREQDEDISQSLWSSVSQVDNTEHIFFPIPTTGRYKLRVVFQSGTNPLAVQRYAIAWWAVNSK